MQVRYNRILAVLMLVAGGLNLFLGGWLLLLGQFQPTLVIAILFVVIGILYWQRPYLIVQPDYVVIPALIGPMKREFVIRSPQDVKLEDGKLLVNDGSQWKRVPVYRWLSHPDDWREMLKYIQSIGAQ